MGISKKQLPNSFVVKNLPDYFKESEVIDIFSGGVQIVSTSAYKTSDEPNACLLGVVTTDPDQVSNALIFDGYEIEPEDADEETPPYTITISAMSSYDLALINGETAEWHKLGDSVIDSSSQVDKSQLGETSKSIEETIKPDLKKVVSEETPKISIIQEEEEHESKSETMPESVKETEQTLQKPEEDVKRRTTGMGDLNLDDFKNIETRQHSNSRTVEVIEDDDEPAIKEEVHERPVKIEEAPKARETVIVEHIPEVTEKKIETPVEPKKPEPIIEAKKPEPVEIKVTPVQIEPEKKATPEEPRERTTAHTTAKPTEATASITRPVRPAERPQNANANAQANGLVEALKPYLGAYVDFNDQQDVTKKLILAVLGVVVAINVFRIIF